MWDYEKVLVDKIQFIVHQLRHSMFLPKDQRALLEKELTKLQKQLSMLRRVLNEADKKD
jgi:hypothetical protein